MTAILGILCEDGIVIGADSSTTFTAGFVSTIEQKSLKIDVISEALIIAGTGPVGLSQRFIGVVQRQKARDVFSKPTHLDVGTAISREAKLDFSSTGCVDSKGHLIAPNHFGAFLAYICGRNFHLCEFDSITFQPEFKDARVWYSTMGSGQINMDSFISFIRRVFWKDKQPNVADGLLFAYWCLSHVIDVNSGGVGGPIKLAAIRKGANGKYKAEMILEDELVETKAFVEFIETEYLPQWKASRQKENPEEIPAAPS